MKAIEFTEDFLEKFFEDNTIEDDNLFDCLKGRKGLIEETSESFENGGKEHMVLQIKLLMKEL